MRVLVVEDSRSLADVLVEGLRDQGMAVDAAHDGLEAAAKLGVNAYDVVVLDRDLPGIHGDALCQMITDRDDRVMVLMLTAAGEPGDRVSGLGLGADDYLAKPFHFPELILRIQALARRQPAARGRILRASGVELDPVRRTASRDGRQLDLSVKEFGVLEALLRASPAYLRAEDLLEQVWDEFADPFTNTVAVTLGRLRRKLGEPARDHHDARRRLPDRGRAHAPPWPRLDWLPDPSHGVHPANPPRAGRQQGYAGSVGCAGGPLPSRRAIPARMRSWQATPPVPVQAAPVQALTTRQHAVRPARRAPGALPAVPAGQLCRGQGPGPCHRAAPPGAAQRPGPSCVPVQRAARLRQDVERPDPGPVAELRAGPDSRPVRRLRLVRRPGPGRAGQHRRDRDRRGLARRRR